MGQGQHQALHLQSVLICQKSQQCVGHDTKVQGTAHGGKQWQFWETLWKRANETPGFKAAIPQSAWGVCFWRRQFITKWKPGRYTILNVQLRKAKIGGEGVYTVYARYNVKEKRFCRNSKSSSNYSGHWGYWQRVGRNHNVSVLLDWTTLQGMVS